MARKLLVVDSSYGFEAVVSRKLQESVTCRDLGGYFEHVWSVHPFASLVGEGATAPFGEPEFHRLSDAHTFIDGKVGRFQALGRLPLLNFAASQADIVSRLVALVRREGVSAIRVGDPLYNGLLGLTVARTCGVPLVVRVNANYDKIYASTGRPQMPRFFRSIPAEKAVLRFVLSRADLVAAVNQDNLEFAISNGARLERSTIFRYGNLIDKRHILAPDSRAPSTALLDEFWPEPYRFLLHIGRLETVKLVDDVIRVLAEVRRQGHDVKALLVGDGQQRDALVRLAQELGVEQHVAFCGNRDQEWLSRLIPQATVVVSPLTGRALTEAAFGAAPVVAYDLDWQGELIVHGVTGELVPSRSLSAMATSVARLISDPEYAKTLGRALRERAFELLDPARLDEHERGAYEKLFRGRAPKSVEMRA